MQLFSMVPRIMTSFLKTMRDLNFLIFVYGFSRIFRQVYSGKMRHSATWFFLYKVFLITFKLYPHKANSKGFFRNSFASNICNRDGLTMASSSAVFSNFISICSLALYFAILSEDIINYRTRAIRPRSIYSIFHFFACGLFEKAVYSRRRSI